MTPNILTTSFNANGNYTPKVLAMSEATAALGKTAAGASRSMGMLSVTSQGVGMSGFSFLKGSMGILALGAAFAWSGKEAMDFEQQMGNVATLVDTSTENMSAMGSEVLKLGKIIPKPISDLTEGLYYIRSAGIDAAHAMDVLKVSGMLATAGLSTVTESAKAITSGLVAFKKQGLSSQQIANSFMLTVKEGKVKMEGLNEAFGSNAPLVAAAGVKLQEFNALTAAMTNAGMTGAEAQNALRMSVLGLMKPTGDMISIFADLHVQTGQEMINAYGLLGALDKVTESAKKLKIEMPHLFNRTGLTSVTLLGGQTASLHAQATANIKEQTEMVNVLGEAYAKQMHTAAASFATFKNGLTTLGVNIGNTLLPALNSLLGVLNPIFSLISDFAKDHSFLTQLLLMGGIAKFATKTFTGLSGSLLSFGSMLGNDTKAMWLFNTAFKRTFWLIAAASLALEGFYKIKENHDQAIEDEKKYNPLGFDFGRSLSNRHDKEIMSKNHVSQDEYDKEKAYDSYRLLQKGRKSLFGTADSSNSVQDSLIKNNIITDSTGFNQNKAVIDSATNDKGFQEYIKGKSSYQAPFIQPQGNDRSKTDELLGMIYDVLKNNQQPQYQPVLASNGQSAGRVRQTINKTFA